MRMVHAWGWGSVFQNVNVIKDNRRLWKCFRLKDMIRSAGKIEVWLPD